MNEIIYTFDTDTPGVAPSNIAVVRGTATVTDDVALGRCVALSGTSKIDAILDLIPPSSILDIKLRHTLNRSGIVLFTNDTAQTGYLIQWGDLESNAIEIYRRSPNGPYGHSQIASNPLPETQDNRWRVTGSMSAGVVTITVFSWDGSEWQQQLQATDSELGAMSGLVALNAIESPVATFDDISVSYELGLEITSNVSVKLGGTAEVGPPISKSLTISSPVQFQTFQRSGSGAADIPLAGTYTGLASEIDARFNGGQWATIEASFVGSNYTGKLPGQLQGQGLLEVRFVDDISMTASVADIGVGDVFVVAGQSNAEGRGASAQNYQHATLKATAFREDNAWVEGNDPIDTGTSIGSYWPLLATRIMADQNIPVSFITTAKGGTGLYNDAWAAPSGDYYINMLQQISNSGVNAIKAILWHQGERDAKLGVTRSQYKNALEVFALESSNDVISNPPLFAAQIGEVDTTSSNVDAIRLAISDAWDDADPPYVFAGPVTYDLELSDGLHFKSDSELGIVAGRWWTTIREELYDGALGTGRGPRITAASFNSERTQITLTFSRDVINPGLSYTSSAFEVSDDGTPVSISGVTWQEERQISIALDAAAEGDLMVSLGSGSAAAGATVPTDTSTYSLPAEPFVGFPVSPGAIYIEETNGGVLLNGDCDIIVTGFDPIDTGFDPIEKGFRCKTPEGSRFVTWKKVRSPSGSDAFVAAVTVCSRKLYLRRR